MMRALLLTGILFFTSAFAQDAPLSKENARVREAKKKADKDLQKRLAKEAKERDKRERREAKRERQLAEEAEARKPAGVEIWGSRKQIKDSLVTALSKGGYMISGDSDYMMGFWKDFQAQNGIIDYALWGDNLPRAYRESVQFQFASQGDKVVLVTPVMERYVQDGYGRIQRFDLNADSVARSNIRTFLTMIKKDVEAKASPKATTNQ